jgi:hypothetical protein
MATPTPDVDALVAQLRARVEERRRRGDYPAALEHELADQARLLLSRRVHNPTTVDVAGPLARIDEALPLTPDRVPDTLVGALVERQTQGILEQVQAFAGPLSEALAALAAAVQDLTAEVAQLRPPLRAVIEHQAVEERVSVQAGARP